MGTRTILLLVAMTAAVPAAYAGPDQATKNRCTAYAQRAVQQYRLMKSHPECEANTDPMNWQDNYDNHYNACVIFPQKMAEMADASRENHLQACGALSDSNTAGASASGSSGGAAGASGAGGASATGGSGGAAPATAAGSTGGSTGGSPNDPECHSNSSGGVVYRGLPGTGITGTQGKVVGNVLTFVSDATKKRVTYTVVRPHFVLVQIHCTGKPNDNTGEWVYASPDGKSDKQIVVGGNGSVLSVGMTAATTRQMIQGQ